MFLFFGTRQKVRAGSLLDETPCKKCSCDVHSSYGIIQYVHLFWVPLFIIGREVGAVCVNCENVLEEKQFTKEGIKLLRKTVFTPLNTLLYHLGGACLVLFFAMAFISLQSTRKETAERIMNPRIGDIYHVDMKSIEELPYGKPFVALKIVKVNNASLVFRQSSKSYSRAWKIPHHLSERSREKNFYKTETVKLSNATITSLHEKDAIKRIYRPDLNKTDGSLD